MPGGGDGARAWRSHSARSREVQPFGGACRFKYQKRTRVINVNELRLKESWSIKKLGFSEFFLRPKCVAASKKRPLLQNGLRQRQAVDPPATLSLPADLLIHLHPLVLLIAILAVTVFRVRDATTTVKSVKLGGFSTGLNIPNLGLDINVTLDLDLTAHNPNRVSFRYGAGTADLLYRGEQVGDAVIPPREIGARSSERMNVSLTIYAAKLIGETALYAEVLSGLIDFQTTTRIPESADSSESLSSSEFEEIGKS
ncbi:hypothetical protein KSP39_PZI017627 [Platanthera zijinensis]|uniref:Late embryogenesis abundant protein LEA-2 subgroup domain-containing protein n=1 Tax=Platanthera zijinensis TaxID=2320716 RepID=A0AAP0B558_9ASPA